MEKFETQKTKLEQESLSSELAELKMREQEMRERLKKLGETIAEKEKQAAEAQSLEESKKAIQRGKFKLLQEEWAERARAKEEEKSMREKEALAKKEKQKAQAKEILKKFLEKEEEKKKEVLIDEAEQEKLIHEALRDREAERLLREFPARADLELAMKQTREELKKPKELEIMEIKYFEGGELPEKVEIDLLTDSKRLEAEAEILAKQCLETEKQLNEKGVDVNKMELSLTERMKLSIKSLFNKKLRSLYRSFEAARMAEDSKRFEAQRLRLAATKPADYIKLTAEKAMRDIARRHVKKSERLKQSSTSPLGWVKRV